MDISIVILNYKTKGLTKQCLKGLELIKPPLNTEIIVVDNASHDGTAELIREEFPQVKFIESPINKGYAGGNNLGLRQAIGKYCLILNPDVSIINNSIEILYNFMEKNPTVGLVGPKLINPDGSFQASCRTFPTPKIIIYRRTPLGKLPGPKQILREHLMLDWDHNQNRPVDWMIGACFFVRSSVLEKVGLLDERFFLYLEDVDWCRQFWSAGYPVYYLAEAEMIHYHQRLSAENPGLGGLFSYATRIHIASAIKYFAKYFGTNKPRIKND